MRVKCLVLFLYCILFNMAPVQSAELQRSLYIRPQLKIGKIENGNGFAEIQYLKWDYYFNPKVSLEGGISTGFTSPRTQKFNYNHSVNRLGIKVTYRPVDHVGLFFEGSFTNKIPGRTNDASYFVYDTYQAVGISLDIREYTFKGETKR